MICELNSYITFFDKNNLSIGGTINNVKIADKLNPPSITDPNPL